MNDPGRAAPLPPDERRAAIIEAVLPLVGERGADVTSRELAAAAGIAEGTLFRAFGDKNALVGAVAVEGLDRAASPERTRAEFATVVHDLPLAVRLEHVIEAGRLRAGDVMRWMGVLRRLAPPPGTSAEHVESMRVFRERLLAQRAEQRAAMIEGVAEVLEPDVEHLRVPLDVVVALLEATTVGADAYVDPLAPAPSAAVVADALVHGILTPQNPEA